jgi:hypothetical protein
MKDKILAHLEDPRQLEKLYRTNKVPFKRDFKTLYPDIRGNKLADFWNERLNYESDDLHWGTGRELWMVVTLSLLAGLVAKLPLLLSVDGEFFYSRNIGFIVFPALSVYFAWKNNMSAGKIALIAVTILAALLFINFLPNMKKSDTLTLSCLHLLLFLWGILGFTFVGGPGNKVKRRLNYLKYNGDLIVMTTLILIAGAIMSGVTIGLFNLIGLHIEKFYFDYVVVFGLAAVPMVGTFLTQVNPQLVGRVSPVIARIFSPLVTVMLIIYLGAIVYSGKDPYQDREFLLIFNVLLIGVMAIIFFSITETSKSRIEIWVLFLLSAITIVVNSIALSAILFRISEWGITPNRAAVLGSNVLILINLLFVTVRLFRVVSGKSSLSGVGESISWYLPVYFFWTVIVTFIFPLLFGFK